MTEAIKGSCLCGSVTFQIDGKIGPVGQCHCSKCRKVSGTDGNAVFYTGFDSFRWVSGEDQICRYEVPGGNGWVSSFCSKCGSPTPHTDSDKKIYFIPAGLMDDEIGHNGYAAHIFVGSKASWVDITDNAPQYVEGFGSKKIA